MPKPATGQLRQLKTGWEARIRIAKNRRKGFLLSTCGTREEAKAKERTALLAALANSLRKAGHERDIITLLEMAASRDGKQLDDVVKAIEVMCAGLVDPIVVTREKAPTFRKVAESWTSGELAKDHPDHVEQKKTAYDDEKRLEKHVYPVVGGVPVDEFTLQDAERVMRALDGGLSRSSRRQVAQLIHRVMALSCYPLRLIDASPIPRGWLPKPAKRKAKAFMYPAEEAMLLAHTEVPLGVRMVYGFLAREGMRKSEALGLDWTDIDLQIGHVYLDENKTDDPRDWPLGRDVAEALRRWWEQRGKPKSGPVFVDADGERLKDIRADELRMRMKAAGIKRPQLHASTDQRDDYDVHAHRGTFVTLALATGRTETWVTDRTGHTSSAMVHRYKRSMRGAKELGLGWLKPLHDTIPELSNGPRMGHEGEASGAGRRGRRTRSSAKSKGCTREDSNLHGGCPPEPKWESSSSITDTSTLGDTRQPETEREEPAHGPLMVQSASPREQLMRALSAAIESGDTHAARVAHRALGELLGDDTAPDGVVDLGVERKRRGR